MSKLCGAYMRGDCRRGDTCWLAHGTDQLVWPRERTERRPNKTPKPKWTVQVQQEDKAMKEEVQTLKDEIKCLRENVNLLTGLVHQTLWWNQMSSWDNAKYAETT